MSGSPKNSLCRSQRIMDISAPSILNVATELIGDSGSAFASDDLVLVAGKRSGLLIMQP